MVKFEWKFEIIGMGIEIILGAAMNRFPQSDFFFWLCIVIGSVMILYPFAVHFKNVRFRWNNRNLDFEIWIKEGNEVLSKTPEDQKRWSIKVVQKYRKKFGMNKFWELLGLRFKEFSKYHAQTKQEQFEADVKSLITIFKNQGQDQSQ